MLGDDRPRFDDALEVATDGAGAGTLRRLAYPVYVTILVALTYGFTFTRFVFVASNPEWVAAHLMTGSAAAVLALLVALAAGFVWRASRQRGAVVPPVAWTDQVLGSSIDRAVAVRPWWHLTLAGTTTGGGLLGVMLGGSLWASQVTGPLALPVAGVVGGLIGALLAHTALWGQVGRAVPIRTAAALRLLRVEELRTQAATGDHFIGALLAGDVRAGQLEVAPPIRRGRSWRLRPGRPVAGIVRRDLLGLRRDPFSWARAALLTVIGATLATWAALEPGAPPILAALGLVLAHFGAAAASEGLRMSADHAGSPPLFGLSRRAAALAHTITPAALTLAAWLVAGAAVAAGVGADPARAAVFVLALGLTGTLTTTATTWTGAFRPPASLALLMPGSGPQLLALRLVTPAALAFVVGILLPAAATSGTAPELARAAAALALALLWATIRLHNATRGGASDERT